MTTQKKSAKTPAVTTETKAELLKADTLKMAKKMIKEGHSKADTAREVFKVMFGKCERKDIIEVFKDDAGCNLSKHGANTYYFNIRKASAK